MHHQRHHSQHIRITAICLTTLPIRYLIGAFLSLAMSMVVWLLWSPLSFAQGAQEGGSTTVTPTQCNQTPSVGLHGIDFTTFTFSNVANGSYLNTGDNSYNGGNFKNAVYQHSLNGQSPGNSTHSGDMLSILDPCGSTGWALTIKMSNLTTSGGLTIPSDTILMKANGVVYYLGDTAALLNDEITGYAINTGGTSMMYPTGTNGGIRNNNANSIEILSRYATPSYNLLYGEFGIDADFFLRVPQYQPAGTYSGTITIDFEWL